MKPSAAGGGGKSEPVQVIVRVRGEPPLQELKPLNEAAAQNGPTLLVKDANTVALLPLYGHSGVGSGSKNSNSKVKPPTETKLFSFDRVLNTKAVQEDVYDIARPLVVGAVEGYNSTIFAYGHTSSGKTYTMAGTPAQPGIIARTVQDVFAMIGRVTAADPDAIFFVRMSYVELYNNNFRNLLDGVAERLGKQWERQRTPRAPRERPAHRTPDGRQQHQHQHQQQDDAEQQQQPQQDVEAGSKFDSPSSTHPNLVRNGKIEVREDKTSGVFLSGPNLRNTVTSAEEAMQLVAAGDVHRAVGLTNCNEHSSRSHAILTIHIESQKGRGEDVQARLGKIHLVDLAGSERLTLSKAQGDRLVEAQSINLSLSSLGNVLAGLSRRAMDESDRAPIPYRDSKLTFFLKDSLGGNSKTLMIATLRTLAEYHRQNLVTLLYASRAKRIQNQTHLNMDTKGESDIRLVARQIEDLKHRLQQRTMALNELSMVNEDNADLRARLQRMSNTNTEEKAELESRLAGVIHSQRGQMEQQRDQFTSLQSRLHTELGAYQQRCEEQQRQIEALQEHIGQAPKALRPGEAEEMQRVLEAWQRHATAAQEELNANVGKLQESVRREAALVGVLRLVGRQLGVDEGAMEGQTEEEMLAALLQKITRAEECRQQTDKDVLRSAEQLAEARQASERAISEMRSEMGEESAALSGRVQGLEEELETLRKTAATRLEGAVKEAVSVGRAAERAELNTSRTALEQENEALKAKMHTFEGMLSGVATDTKRLVAGKDLKLAEMEKRCSMLEASRKEEELRHSTKLAAVIDECAQAKERDLRVAHEALQESFSQEQESLIRGAVLEREAELLAEFETKSAELLAEFETTSAREALEHKRELQHALALALEERRVEVEAVQGKCKSLAKALEVQGANAENTEGELARALSAARSSHTEEVKRLEQMNEDLRADVGALGQKIEHAERLRAAETMAQQVRATEKLAEAAEECQSLRQTLEEERLRCEQLADLVTAHKGELEQARQEGVAMRDAALTRAHADCAVTIEAEKEALMAEVEQDKARALQAAAHERQTAVSEATATAMAQAEAQVAEGERLLEAARREAEKKQRELQRKLSREKEEREAQGMKLKEMTTEWTEREAAFSQNLSEARANHAEELTRVAADGAQLQKQAQDEFEEQLRASEAKRLLFVEEAATRLQRLEQDLCSTAEEGRAVRQTLEEATLQHERDLLEAAAAHAEELEQARQEGVGMRDAALTRAQADFAATFEAEKGALMAEGEQDKATALHAAAHERQAAVSEAVACAIGACAEAQAAEEERLLEAARREAEAREAQHAQEMDRLVKRLDGEMREALKSAVAERERQVWAKADATRTAAVDEALKQEKERWEAKLRTQGEVEAALHQEMAALTEQSKKEAAMAESERGSLFSRLEALEAEKVRLASDIEMMKQRWLEEERSRVASEASHAEEMRKSEEGHAKYTTSLRAKVSAVEARHLEALQDADARHAEDLARCRAEASETCAALRIEAKLQAEALRREVERLRAEKESELGAARDSVRQEQEELQLAKAASHQKELLEAAAAHAEELEQARQEGVGMRDAALTRALADCAATFEAENEALMAKVEQDKATALHAAAHQRQAAVSEGTAAVMAQAAAEQERLLEAARHEAEAREVQHAQEMDRLVKRLDGEMREALKSAVAERERQVRAEADATRTAAVDEALKQEKERWEEELHAVRQTQGEAQAALRQEMAALAEQSKKETEAQQREAGAAALRHAAVLESVDVLRVEKGMMEKALEEQRRHEEVRAAELNCKINALEAEKVRIVAQGDARREAERAEKAVLTEALESLRTDSVKCREEREQEVGRLTQRLSEKKLQESELRKALDRQHKEHQRVVEQFRKERARLLQEHEARLESALRDAVRGVEQDWERSIVHIQQSRVAALERQAEAAIREAVETSNLEAKLAAEHVARSHDATLHGMRAAWADERALLVGECRKLRGHVGERSKEVAEVRQAEMRALEASQRHEQLLARLQRENEELVELYEKQVSECATIRRQSEHRIVTVERQQQQQYFPPSPPPNVPSTLPAPCVERQLMGMEDLSGQMRRQAKAYATKLQRQHKACVLEREQRLKAAEIEFARLRVANH